MPFVEKSGEEGNRRVQDSLAKTSHWASAALYIYLFTMAGTFFIARNILMGSLHLFPRLFFPASLFLQGMSFLAFQYFLVQTPGKLWVKIQWEIDLFTVMGILLYIWQAAEAISFVFTHGNRRGFQPFEQYGDLGTSFLTSHLAFFVSGFFMTYIAACTATSYSLGTDTPAVVHFNANKIIKVSPLDLT